MISATQDLRDEHVIVLKVMEILTRLIALEKQPEWNINQTQKEVIYFLRTFVDRCHHGKEEGILFPTLLKVAKASAEAPIHVMLEEHVSGRELVGAMDIAAVLGDITGFKISAAAYIDLLRSHIDKENSILFEMADKLIPDKDRANIIEKYEAHEEHVMGAGIHEQLHEYIEKWETQAGLEEPHQTT